MSDALRIDGEPIVTVGQDETEALGRRLAAELTGGTVVALLGDLGAGKTVLSRGIARGLGITEPVTSPTFAIVQEYEASPIRLYHMDMYRLQGARDAVAFGVDDFLDDPEAVTVIEWAERVESILPRPYLHVELRRLEDDHRELRLSWVGE